MPAPRTPIDTLTLLSLKQHLFHLLTALAAVFGILASTAPASQAADPPDFSVNGGWFYSQAGGGTGKGFNILDAGVDSRSQVLRFDSEFNRLGGVGTIGYPASSTFTLPDGFNYQATQAALLQWRPETNGVVLANVFDTLSQTGHDKELALLGIPPPIGDDGSGGNLSKARQTRLSWLTNDQIKAKYQANPNPAALSQWNLDRSIDLYGLPTSQPQRFGPFIVQRFQRVAFQLWLDNIPGQPAPGSVVPILGGDLAKKYGLVPAAAQTPQNSASPPGQSFTVHTVPTLQPAVDLLIQYDQAHQTNYVKNLADHHVAVITAAMSDTQSRNGVIETWGLFSPDDNTIRINTRALNEDTHDVADLIAHESSHALDLWTGVDLASTQGCFDTEFNAFKHQADVWLSFYPKLKPAPLDRLDSELNYDTNSITSDAASFRQGIQQLYAPQCSTG